MLSTSFLSLDEALYLLQRFLTSSNQTKQIHSLLLTTNALLPSNRKTKFVYNTLIRSYLTTGHHDASLSLFNHMLANQVKPINLTFPSLVKAASSSFSVSYGLSLHSQALKRCVLNDPFVPTSFVQFYGQVGDLKSSRKMFDEVSDPCVVACNTMLDAFGRNGEMGSALELFRRMDVTADVVSWTTVINGFGKNGSHAEAVMLFREMIVEAVTPPNEATLVSVLSSCANLDRGGVNLGKQIHCYVIRKEIILSTTLGTALVDMYGKGGELETALFVFNQIYDKKVCAWNGILSALASNGRPEEALEMFEVMKSSRSVRPNGITLLAVLTACARSKLVELGVQLFTSICREYKIAPTSEHYGCVVDLMGRAGLLVDAVDFVKSLPELGADASVLGALLGACKIHEDVELGNRVGEMLIGLQPQHCGQYVALSALKALGNNWTEAEEMRKVMIEAGIRKVPAYSVLS